ncbi:hypothetical protein H2248_012581 [Termitomyces sp. 'cryptogamus']|nr:hypothetical protein H2248_012581 [Termitomyces sp. 'cryptogamus']
MEILDNVQCRAKVFANLPNPAEISTRQCPLVPIQDIQCRHECLHNDRGKRGYFDHLSAHFDGYLVRKVRMLVVEKVSGFEMTKWL